MRYHKKWRDFIRTVVLIRDDFKCALCSKRSISNHIHHINNSPGCNTSANLVTLCPYHHKLIGTGTLSFNSKNLAASASREVDFEQLIQVVDMLSRLSG